jgi:hypothetical protein
MPIILRHSKNPFNLSEGVNSHRLEISLAQRNLTVSGMARRTSGKHRYRPVPDKEILQDFFRLHPTITSFSENTGRP